MQYHATTFLAAAAAALMTVAFASSTDLRNQSELRSTAQVEVIKLNTPPSESPGKDVLPCVEIIIRDNTCHFDATEPNYSKAHAECMCSGTTFVDWVRCQQCLLEHGFQSEDNIYWSKILAAASAALCNGAPTAAVGSSLPTPAHTVTAIPVIITPSSGGSPNQPPLETDKNLSPTAGATQAPWAINQTVATNTGVAGPQTSCIGKGAEGFNKQQNNTAPASPTDQPASTTVAVIPTDSAPSVGDSAPSTPTSDSSLLPPGMHSSSESSDAASSLDVSGLAMAIVAGAVMGML
ncbi:collagen mcl1 [Trichoderma arundinaceum]|uniref:Collagen mcl1 n=1 Tax=Trichoderma arundinaceum TaxID=490622 RepID=A0A395NML5_TRIAR|nr:collagen mcl1 [Trichoderma arundinaceum]